ncbi:MAG: alpha/beta hydrolase [Propionibacteriaceae bacterium]|nr:alpha/beta hydrolase [Propionibacteriaceae bacterium]
MDAGFTTSFDGARLFTRTWLPAGDSVGVLQIVHGMAEHSGRYEAFAKRLTAAGWAVYAHDHRGHGHTAVDAGALGHLADQGGWNRAVRDLGVIGEIARGAHPGRPLVLFGHSMGSLLVRDYLRDHSGRADAVVLSGAPSEKSAVLTAVGRAVAEAEARLRGPRERSVLMNSLTFGLFNRDFRPARTQFDWLSRDPAQVDAYIADPLCGGVPTVQFFRDLLFGLRLVNSPEALRDVRRDLPVYLLFGEMDPAAERGRGARRLRAALLAAGVTDVTLKLYPGGRHEMLNEINADEVTDDLIGWLEERRARLAG